jgi:succinylglutamic semialdehyde dehydrogenase
MEKYSYLGSYIDGQFVMPDQIDGEFRSTSPADLNDVTLDVQYELGHVERAVEAARKAFLGWARLPMDERKQLLLKLKDAFLEKKEEMATCISRDTGKPIWETRGEAGGLAGKIAITIEHSVKHIEGERINDALPGVDGVVRFKPRGVMAVLGPFNFPAHLPNGHIIPGLLMGNTIVYKPSELTPAVAQLYAQIVDGVGFPSGVFNLVHGKGDTGRRLVVNEGVDGVLFTGSYDVGLKIKTDTIRHYWKLLALEMGGKNATIVWDDCDLDKAVYETLIGSYMTAGQRCSCTSRIFLHPKIKDEFVDKFYKAAKKIKIGHWSEDVFMGPLINDSAVEKYLRFQEIAKREGCESLMRGKVLELSHKGHYVTPSIHLVDTIDPKSIYQKSEIFGPNVAIYTNDDFQEVLDTINSSGYGLAMALFTKNQKMYEKALLEAKVGILNFNRTSNGASSKLPFGGMGKSGNDRPSADFAIQYTAVPVASLEDGTDFDPTKIMTGLELWD